MGRVVVLLIMLFCWCVGLLVCWFVGLLVGWFVGLLGCWFGVLFFVVFMIVDGPNLYNMGPKHRYVCFLVCCFVALLVC